MRICLVTHGFPPVERTGVENYTLGLARALVRAGQHVEVFVPRRDPALADHSLRREERAGFAVNWITTNRVPAGPRDMLLYPEVRDAFAAFLDRERPEVVHFQHLIKLGIELIDVARERGIPTVYTVHDYYPICHRYTLLRPDLTHCDARADALACSRCDLALGYLNGMERLGDYQMGALPGQLAPAERATLAALLAGAANSFAGPSAQSAAFSQRSELDELRARAFRKLDLVLSPSRFLADELVRGGFERERVVVQPFGFDNADLEALPGIRRAAGRPLRFAFLGGLSKHKGVHVLLDAFGRVPAGAELSIWGASSDRAYVELLRQQSSAVGALWRGPYERPELPGILAEIDAVVLPSLWVENYPLVIREAFSARRPVLASRVGALPESVRDGVDGLLFEPGDVADLARVLRRCVEEHELLPRLAAGIAPQAGVDPHARELLACYERARASAEKARVPERPLLSLQDALARHRELSSLPARELFARTLTGLDGLREAWAPDIAGLGGSGALELLALGLGEGSEAQDRLREARAEIVWLRNKEGELVEGREELMTVFEDLDRLLGEARAGKQQENEHLRAAEAYVRQKEAEVSQAHARLSELEQALSQKNRHLDQVEGELIDAGRHIQRVEGELTGAGQRLQEFEGELGAAGRHIQRVEGELGAAGQRIQRVEGELDAAGQRIQRVEGELDAAGQRIQRVEGELDAAGQRIQRVESQRNEAERALQQREQEARQLGQELARAGGELRARESELRQAQEGLRVSRQGTRGVAEVGLTALEAQARVLGGFLRPILVLLHRAQAGGQKLELPAEGAHLPELVGALRQVLLGLEAVERELAWRRGEMGVIARRAQGFPLRLLLGRTHLGRRLETWRQADGGAAP